MTAIIDRIIPGNRKRSSDIGNKHSKYIKEDLKNQSAFFFIPFFGTVPGEKDYLWHKKRF